MLGPDVLMTEALSFLCAIRQHTFALVAQRKVNGGRDFLAYRGVRFNLLSNRLDRGMGSKKAIRKRLVLTKKAQQQVFGFNVRTAELASLVPCKEDNAAGFLGISFKHRCHRQDGLRLLQLRLPASHEP